MDPVLLVLLLAAVTSAACWILSLVTKDTSWVDRIWSIVPIAYTWIFAIAVITSGGDAARSVLMAALVTLWGARLTFNFARKGGYSGMEDYRWAILRRRMSPVQFQLFNLFFIVLYQNALLVLISLPALMAWEHPTPLTGWDIALAALFLAFLVGETVADQEQWDFHQAKKRAGGTLEPGFAMTGLFRLSRHPNFFFEQAQWWVFYFIGAVAAVSAGLGFWGGLINPTIVGAVLLTVLFIGSTIFTESISSSKYPAYADYQRRTSMLVPLPPRRTAAPRRA
ncbi:DUF1295 domain-containing protein [Microbacterium sp. zg.Y1090]|uniref:DUF1295 domain-containing protein n=1 Tax=Microbacterium wangruii TaxID=3049073 RepID=UPI00214D71EA|nr:MULTISPECIES: DUF1295 domain-containing protein [unclassified Microbacterium]MCR2819784.1 DUF1295 domain-containing protein [Microbacterium sp. zg.Y1090]MDL5485483.1 DUF1295 domain-containing protein [Microbacterium sp. zg-Y1211]WIM28656.1 DUF1295 domain-containing protein [Microbacterium sp. zg-Y1090]